MTNIFIGGDLLDFYLLGQRIRQERIRNHLSQEALAEKIEVSTNYIGQIERGDRKPSVETLISLCNALNTTLDFIMQDNLDTADDAMIRSIVADLNSMDSNELLFIQRVIQFYKELLK